MKAATSPLDLGFIREVYGTSVWVTAVTAFCVLGYAGSAACIGLLAGAALALGSLWLIEWSVQRFVGAVTATADERAGVARGAGGSAGRALLGLLGAGKYLLLGLAVAGVVALSRSGALNLLGFVGGVAMIHGVIVLKAVGAWLFPERPDRNSP